MVDKLASHFVSKYFGKYVEGLDSIDVGIFSSRVKFNYLKVKDNIFDEYELPFTVKRGVLEHLEIYIPVTSIRSKPCEVFLSGLHVVVGPKNTNGPNSEEALIAAKMNRLKAADLFNLDKIKKFSASDVNDSKTSWSEKIINRILLNVKFSVENIHIRYEDDINTIQPFSFGITIQSISAFTTDAYWNPYFLKDIIKGELRKMIQIKYLSVYLNDEQNKVNFDLANETLPDFIHRMKSHIYRVDNKIKLDYVLYPFSTHIKYYQSDAMDLHQNSQRVINFLLGNHIFSLNNLQYRCLMELMKYFDMKLNFKEYYVKRPSSTPSQNPKEWWHYITQCAIKETEQKRNARKWDYIERYMQNWKTYIKIYEKKLLKDSLNRAERLELLRLETEMKFDDIIYYRKMASAALVLNKERKYRNKKSDLDFYSNLFAELKVDQGDEIPHDNLSVDFLKTQLQFELKEGSLRLKKDEMIHPFATLRYSQVNFNISLRDNASTSVCGYIDSLKIEGRKPGESILLSTPGNDPTIGHALSWDVHIKSSLTESWSEEDIVDLRVSLSAHPLKIHLNRDFMGEMQSFFLSSSYNIKDAADIIFSLMKRKAKDQIKEVIETNPTMVLDIHLPVPHVVIELQKDLNFVVKLDDTKIQGNNTQRERTIPSNVKDQDVIQEMSYDTYLCKVQGVFAYFMKGRVYIPLVDKFDMVLMSKVLTKTVENLPVFQFDFYIQNIQAHFSKSIAEHLLDLIQQTLSISAKIHDNLYLNTAPSLLTIDHLKKIEFVDNLDEAIIPSTKDLKIGMSFLMENFNFFLHDSDDVVWMLNAQRANANVLIANNTVTSEVQLNSFSIIDYYTTRLNNESTEYYTIKSSEHDPILKIRLMSNLESKKHDIAVAMGCIDVFIYRPSIAYTTTLISDYITLFGDYLLKDDIKESQKIKKIGDRYTIDIGIAFKELNINLMKECENFFTTSIGDVEVSIAMLDSGKRIVQGTLRTIKAESVDNIQWKTLLVNIDDKVGSFSIRTNELKENYILVAMNGIQISVLSNIVEELVLYFSEFWSVFLMFGWKLRDIESKSYIDLRVSHPIVLIPQASKSTDYIKIDLGEISIVCSRSGNLHNIALNLNRYNIYLCHNNYDRKILDDVSFSLEVDIMEPTPNVNDHSLGFEEEAQILIKTHIPSMKFHISDRDLTGIFRIFEGNMSEKVVRVEKEEITKIAYHLKRVNQQLFKKIFQTEVLDTKTDVVKVSMSVDYISITLSLERDKVDTEFLLLHCDSYLSEINISSDQSSQYTSSIKSFLFEDISSNHKDLPFKSVLKKSKQADAFDHFTINVNYYSAQNVEFVNLHLTESEIYLNPFFSECLTDFLSYIIPSIYCSTMVWIHREKSGVNIYRRIKYESKKQQLKAKQELEVQRRRYYMERMIDSLSATNKEEMRMYREQCDEELKTFEESLERKYKNYLDPEKSSLEVNVKLILNSCNIYILQEFSEKSTSIMLNFEDCIFKHSKEEGGKQFYISVSDYSLFKCFMLDYDTVYGKFVLLKPFDTTISIRTVERGQNVAFVDVLLSDVSLVISYRDVDFLIGLYKRYHTCITKIASVAAQEPLEKLHALLDLAQLPVKLHSITVYMHVSSTEIVLINDLNLVSVSAICKVGLVNPRFTFQADEMNRRKLIVTIPGLQMMTFNDVLSSYESFFEKSHIEMEMTQNELSVEFKISVRGTMNLNITQSLVQTILSSIRAYEMFSEAIENQHSNVHSPKISSQKDFVKERTYAPFSIRNETDKHVSLKEASYLQSIEIQPGQEYALDLKSFSEMNGTNVCLYIPLKAGVLDVKIPLQKMHSKKYTVKYEGCSYGEENFMYEIVNEYSRKVIIIRYPNCIKNETSMPIDVQFSHKGISRIITIEPNTRQSIPTEYTMNMEMKLRPSNSSYSWGPYDESIQSIVCFSETRLGTLWSCSIQKQERVLSNGIETQLVLVPSLCIENHTHEILSFKATDINAPNEVVASGVVEGHKDIDIYELSCDFITYQFSFQLPGYRWSRNVTIPETTMRENVIKLPLEHINEKLLTLQLWFEKSTDSFYGLKIIILCEYTIINQTGLPLFYDDKSIISKDESVNFSIDPSHWYSRSTTSHFKTLYSQSILALKVGADSSPWSDPLNLGNGEEFEDKKITVPFKEPHEGIFCFTLRKIKPIGKYWRSNIIKIVPTIMMVNKTKKTIQYCQVGHYTYDLGPDSTMPFHWVNKKKEKKIQLKIKDTSKLCSPFSVTSTYFLIKSIQGEVEQKNILRVTIYEDSGISYIVISDGEEGISSYRIINCSTTSLFVSQKGRGNKELIQKEQSILFYPEHPLEKPIRLVLDASSGKYQIELDADKNYHQPVEWNVGNQLYLIHIANNDIYRHIRIYSKDTDKSNLKKQSTSNVPSKTFSIGVTLPAIGISIMSQFKEKKTEELFYIYLQKVYASVTKNDTRMIVFAKVKMFQADQTFFYPPKMIMSGCPQQATDFLNLSLELNLSDPNLKLFEKVSVQAQQITVEMSQNIAYLISEYIENVASNVSLHMALESQRYEETETVLPVSSRHSLGKVFLKDVVINGFNFVISFKKDIERYEEVNKGQGIVLRMVQKLFRSNMKEYYLDISKLESYNILSSYEFLALLESHYKHSLFYNVPRILGSFFKFYSFTSVDAIAPIRLPRYIPEDGLLMEYSAELAYGQDLLRQYSLEGSYVCHGWLYNECIIASNTIIALVDIDGIVKWKKNVALLRNVIFDGESFSLFFDSYIETEVPSMEIIQCHYTIQAEDILAQLESIVKNNEVYIRKHVNK